MHERVQAAGLAAGKTYPDSQGEEVRVTSPQATRQQRSDGRPLFTIDFKNEGKELDQDYGRVQQRDELYREKD